LGIDRLGVFGGTFNPIHSGHLYIAGSVRQLFSLSEILFVVAAAPPHKPKKDLVELMHRYAMVSLATSGEPAFIPSLVEIEPYASPYSVDTMRKITRNFGRDCEKIYFIAGGDSLRDVRSWRESEKLLASYNFIFILRSGVDTAKFREYLPEQAWGRVRDYTGLDRNQIRESFERDRSRENRLFIIDIDAPGISATKIRNQAASGEDLRGCVPDPVCEYIRKMQLYGDR